MDGNCDADVEEINIQDIIGGYYEFFQSFAELRDTVECAHDIGEESRGVLSSILDNLEGMLNPSHPSFLRSTVVSRLWL